MKGFWFLGNNGGSYRLWISRSVWSAGHSPAFKPGSPSKAGECPALQTLAREWAGSAQGGALCSTTPTLRP